MVFQMLTIHSDNVQCTCMLITYFPYNFNMSLFVHKVSFLAKKQKVANRICLLRKGSQSCLFTGQFPVYTCSFKTTTTLDTRFSGIGQKK